MDQLLSEDVDIKNEMHAVFKKLEGGFSDLLNTIGKLESPYSKIVENLKEYALNTAEDQQQSPFFGLAQKYEGLIDAQKQYVHDVTDDVLIVLQQLVSKSELLNDSIKDLSSAAKNARKLSQKIAKIEADIEDAQAKGKPDKATKKLAEKETKTAEFDTAKSKLSDVKDRFDKLMDDFNSERNELLKKSLTDLIADEKKYIEVMQAVITEIENTVEGL